MEYLLTKLLPLFVYPLGLSIIFLLSGLCFVSRGRSKLAGFSIFFALSVLVTSALPVVADYLLTSLERDYPAVSIEELPAADAIVVLGGAAHELEKGSGRFNLSEASDRILYGLQLYRAGKAPRIFLTGGASPGFTSEAELVAGLLVEFEVPAHAITYETSSRNTRENALNLLSVIERTGSKRVLLVTSAIHMRRARAVFAKAGFDAIPAATDYQVTLGKETILDWVPKAEALYRTTLALKEYIGWWVYKFRGWV